MGTMAYMDDILVYGKDEAEHETRLTEVLKVLRAAGLKLNEDKCHYGQNYVPWS